MAGRRIQRDRKGGYRLKLPREERELLASLPAQRTLTPTRLQRIVEHVDSAV